jgi:hypothetical protein
MPQSYAQLLNSMAVKGETKSAMAQLGIMKRCMMSWMNLTAFAALYFTSDFDPLGEFVDCNEDVLKSAFGLLEWSYLI